MKTNQINPQNGHLLKNQVKWSKDNGELNSPILEMLGGVSTVR